MGERHGSRVRDRDAHGGALEQIDGVDVDIRSHLRHASARAVPRDEWRLASGEQVNERAAGEPGGARHEDQRGTPLSAPLNGEKLPRPASVNDRKNRRSEGSGNEELP